MESVHGNAKRVTACAPGKLILLGEYAVLEGAPALVTAVDRFARVRVEDAGDEGSGYSVESPEMGIPPLQFEVNGDGGPLYLHAGTGMEEKLRFFSAAFQFSHELLKRLDRTVPPCHILLDTSEFYYGRPPLKLGFGSSASLTLAITRALTVSGPARENYLRDDKVLYRTALSAHHQAQGRAGSGIDIAASIWGGLLEFRKNKPVKSLSLPGDLHFVTAWTGKPASTTQLLADVARFKAKNPGPYRTLIQEMSRLSSRGIQSLRKNDVPDFLLAVNGYYEAMDRLGQWCAAPVISEEHRLLARIARDNGAAYKPSGAGGGDCGIAFSHAEKTINNTRNAMKKAGFHCPAITMVDHGIEFKKVYEES